MSVESSDASENQKPAAKREPAALAECRLEKGTEPPAASVDAVKKKEESLFGSGEFCFSSSEPKPKTSSGKPPETGNNTDAKSEGKNRDEPKQIDLTAAIKAENVKTPQSKTLQGVDGMIESAKDYWQELADDARKEGGLKGNAAFLCAEIMQGGVSAFKKVSDLKKEHFPDGLIVPAEEFWKDAAKNAENEKCIAGDLKFAGAKIMAGFLDLSNLPNVSRGVDKVIDGMDKGVSPEQLRNDALWLGLDTGLAAATLVPGFKCVQGLMKGEKLFRTASAGTKIAGMATTEMGLVEKVSSKLSTAVAEAFPAGKKVASETLENFVGKLKSIASEYKIGIKEGGTVGESTSVGMDLIQYSSKAGGPHEVGHVFQQLQTRMVALESQASKLGKKVLDLTKSERDEAFEKIVKPFEDLAYNQHEMWAGKAHSWGVTAKNYSEVLLKNMDSFARGLSTGTVPEAAVGSFNRLYGSLPNWLGRCQAQIGRNLGSPTAIIMGQNLHD